MFYWSTWTGLLMNGYGKKKLKERKNYNQNKTILKYFTTFNVETAHFPNCNSHDQPGIILLVFPIDTNVNQQQERKMCVLDKCRSPLWAGHVSQSAGQVSQSAVAGQVS